MNKGFFTLKEALEVFKNKDAKGMYLPFDITYRTFNEQTKKGGKLKQHRGVKYLPEAKQSTDVDIVISDKHIKPPNHFENRTRNIELSTGDVRSVRIDFIISINNIKVIY